VQDRIVGDDLGRGFWPGCLSRVAVRWLPAAWVLVWWPVAGVLRVSSHRLLVCWQRRAMMPATPLTGPAHA
jgi:hypothetical protein